MVGVARGVSGVIGVTICVGGRQSTAARLIQHHDTNELDRDGIGERPDLDGARVGQDGTTSMTSKMAERRMRAGWRVRASSRNTRRFARERV